MFAQVILDIKHEEVNQMYDYIVPKDMVPFLARGMRVMVPFGAQTRLGIVFDVIQQSNDATKPILDVLDPTPVIDDELFMMMDDLYQSTYALKSAIFQTVLPNEIMMNYQKKVHILDEQKCPKDLLPFFNHQKIWVLKKKDQSFYPRLKRLHDQNVIKIERIIKQKEQEKLETAYRLNEHHTYQKINNYESILDQFKNEQIITRKTLLEKGVSISSIKTLIKHAVLIEEKQVLVRDIKHIFDLKDKKVMLNDAQNHAVKMIESHFKKPSIFLLKGVTGSGKTEVYLSLIEKVISQGKKVLYLVPEITLIGPAAQRLKSRFDDVQIYHSGLSKGERYDAYQNILSQKASIVLGTRSATFLPIDDLGLMIMDEEHDQSYVQKEGVMYHTRNLLIKRGLYHSIPLVLGSATPSIESMYHAKEGTYHLLELKDRPFFLPQPKLYFVDMKHELKQNNTSVFSNLLLEKMKDRLIKKEQTMLLFNRKGYAPFVLCRSCGDVPKCPHCDVSLTYYKDLNTLKCHYCGYEKPFDTTCALCNEKKVKEVGVGIEYIEHMLKKALPEAKVLRMDQHTTRLKNAHEDLWHQFLTEDYDILIGTQMIAKGLDFPKVTLSAVLMADMLLKVPSYEASESTFNLLTQITGRSGRFLPGEAIIQGYQLDHYAIKSIESGYDTFYEEAIKYRHFAQYAPFKENATLLITGYNFLKTYQHAFYLKKMYHSQGYTVLGPSFALIKKIKDQYRMTLTFKAKKLDVKNIIETKEKYAQKDISVIYYPTLDIL
ncbi:MAG: primosomal protein N' [Tenericutes bacterium HGW-Tenericutes-6]|nr:MAG: primosomal protein N' [Tenericutes bacterium HGW-Tenericutes-6]